MQANPIALIAQRSPSRTRLKVGPDHWTSLQLAEQCSSPATQKSEPRNPTTSSSMNGLKSGAHCLSGNSATNCGIYVVFRNLAPADRPRISLTSFVVSDKTRRILRHLHASIAKGDLSLKYRRQWRNAGRPELGLNGRPSVNSHGEASPVDRMVELGLELHGKA